MDFLRGFCEKTYKMVDLLTCRFRLEMVIAWANMSKSLIVLTLLGVVLLTGCSVFEEIVMSDGGDAAVSSAADADVLNVRAVQTGSDTWTFHVTVAHPDTGWEDYADGWDVMLPDGSVIKPDPNSPFTRLLLHPHENEQPFTRSQSNIVIPPDVTEVTVRAHDIVDGFGGREVIVDLTAEAGDSFTVERQ